jgi:hypothetical protein
MNYKKLNISLGWLAFLIATIVYFITIEDTVSLWDCGEYITAAYKLEVGHPPGAPLFMLFGRLFSFFADTADVALWINRMSALSSSFSIVFMFWTITMLGKKIAFKPEPGQSRDDARKMSKGQMIAILGSGFVGAMAYTFTESFWFSAVEGEVYAMSSLFTAVIFWALLKWDEETTAIKHGELNGELRPMRWMIFIMFLFGLAIGVHLLGLLVLPCMAYVIMFNYKPKINTTQFFVTGIIGVVVLAFIQNGVIPGTIALASAMEVFFVNNLGTGFMVGATTFFILLIAVLSLGLIWTRKKGFKYANSAILGLIVLFIGYGSFATIVIRSNANTPLDENNPENLVTLHAYLKREQYGSWPISYGQYWNSKTNFEVDGNASKYKDRSPFYDRRYVVVSTGGSEVKSFKLEKDAKAFAQSNRAYTVTEKYFETNKNTRKNQVPTYAQNTFLPRMYWSNDANRIEGYKYWSGYDENRKVPKNMRGSDDRPLPTFGNNIQYMVDYQFGWMYWRYFMWNFAGRQNDIQGHGRSEFRGNYKSGFDFIDETRLGAMGENEFFASSNNPSNNSFYFIPLILGLIGLFFHFLKAPKDAFVVLLLFLFTGFAIVIYLNQKPYEPRERDYAYAASFYAFAIWIGLGVYGLFEAYRSFTTEDYKKLGTGALAVLGLSFIGYIFTQESAVLISGILIVVIACGSLLLMGVLKKAIRSKTTGASIATALGLIAPIILGVQGWDDHDRSERTSARDLAYNYLAGCAENSILYTNGDNDTFPLWYLQEVEGVKTDVRVANLSLMQTDWYTNQMKMKAYDSDPLPIKFTEEQILMGAGNTDYVVFGNYLDILARTNPESVNKIVKAKIENNQNAYNAALSNVRKGLASALQAMKAKDVKIAGVIPVLIEQLNQPISNGTVDDYNATVKVMDQVFKLVQNGQLEGNQQIYTSLNQARESWLTTWDFLPIDLAMEFVRDEANALDRQGGSKMRFFPSKGFILPVEAENAVASGVIDKSDIINCEKEIRFDFRAGRMFRSDVQGLSREEVMMMDILANNDWKRGTYFSSAGGSDVAKALYAKNRIVSVGLVSVLSPLKLEVSSDRARTETFKNMTEVYGYGNLQDGALADYYVRRHTSQFRSGFNDLAYSYLAKADRDLSSKIRQNEMMLSRLENAEVENKARIKDSLTAQNNSLKQEVTKYKDSVSLVIKKALTVLPISSVLDMGEPREGQVLELNVMENGRATKKPIGRIAEDGSIANFIFMLYEANDIELGEKLASEYLDQLETYLRYYENSDKRIAYRNQTDFFSFANNLLNVIGVVYSYDESRDIAVRAIGMEQRLSTIVVPEIIASIENTQSASSKERNEARREAKAFEMTYKAIEQLRLGYPALEE